MATEIALKFTIFGMSNTRRADFSAFTNFEHGGRPFYVRREATSHSLLLHSKTSIETRMPGSRGLLKY